MKRSWHHIKRAWHLVHEIHVVAWVVDKLGAIGAATTLLPAVFSAIATAAAVAEHLPLWLIAVIFSVVYAASGFGAAMWRNRQQKIQLADQLQPPAVSMTHDQRAFRLALKQFSLTFPEKLERDSSRVRAVLIQRIKSIGDKDYSYALHHAMHFAWSAGSTPLRDINRLADGDSEHLDIEALQDCVVTYFHEYQWMQKSIANLNVLAKISLEDRDEVVRWLDTDRACWSELEKLRIFPEAGKLRQIGEHLMAFPGENWSKPFRVNF